MGTGEGKKRESVDGGLGGGGAAGPREAARVGRRSDAPADLVVEHRLAASLRLLLSAILRSRR